MEVLSISKLRGISDTVGDDGVKGRATGLLACFYVRLVEMGALYGQPMCYKQCIKTNSTH